MTIRVLCSGDIHVGRRSSKVEDIFRSADAWGDIVNKAIEHQVDLVALSGDLVDKESKSYEALGPMRHGLARLSSSGIDTVAVAGNHDHDVLVRLATITGNDRFHLIGKNSQWERFTLIKDGTPVLHVDGWSFPTEHIRQAPLQTYANPSTDRVPIMGLLHGDIGVINSPYAPITEQELWAAPFAFTLLGHIHMPRIFGGPEGKKALYPGSPYALDPGEPGVHGAWLAEIEHSGTVSLQQIPISPVHYATVDLDLDGVIDESEFQSKLNNALNALGERTIEEHGSAALKVVSARLVCSGRCPSHHLVDSWIQQAEPALKRYEVGSILIEVEKITSLVRPPIDLHQRSNGSDPVAEAAKIILAMDLKVPDPPYIGLIQDTLRQMRSIHGHSGYARLRARSTHDETPSESDARECIRSRAWEMLSLLVMQKEME